MSERRQVLELFEEYKDFTKDRVEHGIELYRKGYAYLTVKDENGEPVQDAKVTVKQKSHEFRFGANLFMLDELETDEKNEAYKKHFAETFNMATLPFYWDATEPEEGKTRYHKDAPPMYRRPPIDRCMAFCEQNGIEPREHGLAYDNFYPRWLYNAPVSKIKQALNRRCREIAERYADKINTIEVTNEMCWDRERARTAFYEEPDYVAECFRLADHHFPANQLVINEVTRLCWEDKCRASDRYYGNIQNAIDAGARIDAIGMQYHQFHKREVEYEKTRVSYDPVQLYRHMDLYAQFGKPLQVTEVTVPAYSWEAEDEEIQAEILRNLYSIWFSHPNMEQIVYWNLVDGYAHVWDPDPEKIRASQGNMTLGENYYHGGLLRFDMTPKPAFFVIKDLIEKRWHTEAEMSTNGMGKAQFKGFFGRYEVTVEYGGKTVTKEINLAKKGRDKFELIV
ncbi:MAG: glycoside hydrolase family 10 [Ruminococcaceae bacterium]|nr:glycoside hydrolase family 10 [Oscillospiraceae bacterium]